MKDGYGISKIAAKESWGGKAILVSKEGCDL